MVTGGTEPLAAGVEVLLVNSITDYAIYMLDPNGIVTSWNAGAERFKGYTRDEIIGQHFSQFYTPEDRERGIPARALARAAEVGRDELEGWRLRKDGSRFWANAVIDAIRDSDGRLLGFAKITRDLTEKKIANDALKASEERFRILVEGVTDYAIYMLDPAGFVSNWNPGAERIKGYRRDEIVGRHFSTFYTDEDRAAGMPATALAIAAHEGRYEKEGWRVRKDGTHFWAHVVIDRILDDKGEIIGFAKITRDVTERKHAQEALDSARAALAQAQKMEAIGQLTGGVAHDFNNLLTVIVGGLDLLSSSVTGKQQRRLIENMHKAAARGQSLTQQLLAFARRQPLRPARHRPGALIRGFEPVLRRACGEQIDFLVDIATATPTVLLDAPQFEVALLNLVVNARDAMPDGGQIVLSTNSIDLDETAGRERHLPAGRYAVVSVADTGCGMEEKVLARATEPFFTTKEVGKGTGLGLSQVFGFAAQSGGRLDIDSAPGRGSTISILLPAAPDGVDAENDDDERAEEQSSPLSGSVLIVEDEAEVRDIAQQLFETLGYEVLLASTGKEALEVLAGPQRIDVLFSDVVMPGEINGVALAHKALEIRPGMKILLASGYPMSALAERGLTQDVAFLSKPYRWTELVDRLRSMGRRT